MILELIGLSILMIHAEPVRGIVEMTLEDSIAFQRETRCHKSRCWALPEDVLHMSCRDKKCQIAFRTDVQIDGVSVRRGYPHSVIVTADNSKFTNGFLAMSGKDTVLFRSKKEIRATTINEKIFGSPQVEIHCERDKSCIFIVTPDP